jgi:hypothetical protein
MKIPFDLSSREARIRDRLHFYTTRSDFYPKLNCMEVSSQRECRRTLRL